MAHSYRFGEFEVLPDERRMLVGGQPAPLSARAFDVLTALIDRRDRIVTKDELLDLVWPGLYVEENNLHVHVSALRKLLGRGAIATIPGRGYRFTAPLAGDSPASPAPRAPATGLAGNLGCALEALVGREEDLQRAEEALAQARLVTLLGTGGVGKSRLARELGRARVNAYPDGVWWVDLANLTKAEDLAAAVAAAAGLQLGPGEPLGTLSRALTARGMLLVLDNCEHLVDAVASLAATLLATAPGVSLLATSQAPLKVHGEVVYRVEPLAIPRADASLADAREAGSVALFERRVRALDRRFQLEAGNLADVVSTCRQLDGLPLAIEMAAARAPLMGPTALAERLGERLNLLRGNHRDAAARHETLRATLDWSYELLKPDEQVVLRRLAMFRGSFALDVAQRLCLAVGLDEWNMLDALDVLVDRSLVQVEPGPRYRLLETTRIYALERLRAAGEQLACEVEHGRVMANLAREAVAAFRGEPGQDCVLRYKQVYADLGSACERAVARQDTAVAAWTGEALMRIDLERNISAEIPRRKELLRGLLSAAAGEDQARLWSCLTAARTLVLPGMSKRDACNREVAAWRKIGDRVYLYEALSRSAAARASGGDNLGAEAHLAEAKRLEDPAWAPQVRLVRAFNACMVSAFGDDTELFTRRIEEELPLAEAAGSSRFLGNVSLFRAEAAVRSGRPVEAIDIVRPVLARKGWEVILGYSCFCAVYCQALLALDRDAEAVEVARAQLPHAQVHGVTGWFYDVLAAGAARQGDRRAAAQWLAMADSAYAAAQEVRRPQDRRLESEARKALERVRDAN